MGAPQAWRIEVVSEQDRVALCAERVRQAVECALRQGGYEQGEVGVRLVNDTAIAALHARWMNDDTPTDVLSFPLHAEAGRVEGDIIASAETACRVAGALGWPPEHELLLYVVHGALHLAGYDDLTPQACASMRAAEQAVFAALHLPAPPATGGSEP